MDKEDKKPIEEYFPIAQVNEIADKESKAKRYYRPVYTMHKWWARRLGCIFRTILLYSLADEDMNIKTDGMIEWDDWDGEPEKLWNYYLKDVDFSDKTVLDPFMGGGTTIVEALRMNCNVVGKDLNPVAWFTVKKETDPVDIDKLENAFEKLKQEVAPEIKKYYKTTCPASGEEVDAVYYFWVKELDCRNCSHTTPLFKDYRIAKARSKNVEHKHKAYRPQEDIFHDPGETPEDIEKYDHNDYYHVLCPNCEQIFETSDYKSENKCPHCKNNFNPKEDGNAERGDFVCPDCGQKNNVIDTISEQGKPKERLYAIEYWSKKEDKKGYKPAKKEDKQLYQKAVKEYEEKKDSLPIPDQEIPEGHNTNQAIRQGYDKFKEMFNKRQLLSHGKLLKRIEEFNSNIKEFVLLAFSQSLDSNNTMCSYDATKKGLSNILCKCFSFRKPIFEHNGKLI